jgi:hypothetical protein
LVAGTGGMGLATVIRLEFAYPGVGVLAGDSLQYLSIATAHGVIMVFYMIMPAIFGAFGNFLLPTQLGVHDVAFPRLNSAAFWFLPGGVIMLFQLVCTDRRYARMNCFNIRELQGVLKRKFFPDLVSSHNYRGLMAQSMIGLRFRLNGEDLTSPDTLSFHNFGLKSTDLNKFVPLSNSTGQFAGGTVRNTLRDSLSYRLLVSDRMSIAGEAFRSFSTSCTYYMCNFTDYLLILFRACAIFFKISLSNVLALFPSLGSIATFIVSNLSLDFTLFKNLLLTIFGYRYEVSEGRVSENPIYKEEIYELGLLDRVDASYAFSETIDNTARFNRYNNALINYDYKTGNYVGY